MRFKSIFQGKSRSSPSIGAASKSTLSNPLVPCCEYTSAQRDPLAFSSDRVKVKFAVAGVAQALALRFLVESL